jgi:hypothetical protein
MTIDNVLNVQHLQCVQNYPFIVSDYLFDLNVIFASLLTNLTPILFPMYGPLCTIVPTNYSCIPKIINIHFDVSLLYEDHGINSLQTYVDKMAISAKCGGLWDDNGAIFCLENYLQRPIYV